MTHGRIFSKGRTCFYNLDKRTSQRQGHGKASLSKRRYLPEKPTNSYKGRAEDVGTRTAWEQPRQRMLLKVNVTLKLRSDRKILTVYTRDSLLHVYHRALEIHLVQNKISSECKTYIVLMTSWKNYINDLAYRFLVEINVKYMRMLIPCWRCIIVMLKFSY